MWYFALAFCAGFIHFNCEATNTPNKSSSSSCFFPDCGCGRILSHILFKLSLTTLIISNCCCSACSCLFLRVSFVCLDCFDEDCALFSFLIPCLMLSWSVVLSLSSSSLGITELRSMSATVSSLIASFSFTSSSLPSCADESSTGIKLLFVALGEMYLSKKCKYRNVSLVSRRASSTSAEDVPDLLAFLTRFFSLVYQALRFSNFCFATSPYVKISKEYNQAKLKLG